MVQEVLEATQQAAWAAQSAADAAWWALLINGIAATGAVAAVIWAIYLARSDVRAARNRDGVLLMASATLASNVMGLLESYEKKLTEGREDYEHMANVTLQTIAKTSLVERIERLDAHLMPDLETYSAFESARLEISHVMIDLDQAKATGTKVQDTSEHITQLRKFVETLNRAAASRMHHGDI